MKALLLAAGYGKRLRPITLTTPKCLVEINGKPLLNYWIEILENDKISEILINTNYLTEIVEENIKNLKIKKPLKILREDILLGTGGTILKNKTLLKKDTFLLIHADNLSLFNLDEFLEAHVKRPKGTLITMMIFKTDVPKECGIIELLDNGVVKEFHEKVKNPPGNLANGAVYLVEPTIIQFLETLNKDIIDFSTEVLPYFLNKIYTYENTIYHRDIGTIKSLNIAKKEIINFL